MSKSKNPPPATVKVSRDAGTGKFVTDKFAVNHPKTTVTETVKRPIEKSKGTRSGGPKNSTK